MSEKFKKKYPPQKGAHGTGAAMSQPTEKAKDFNATLKRLLGYLRPHKIAFFIVFLTSALSTAFNIVSPAVIGLAIDKLFEGIMARLQGSMHPQVDYVYIRNILLILAGLYIFSSVFKYIEQILMVKVAQKTVYDLREDFNQKLTRLPLKYFDGRPYGEILSRVTNDIDNISATLQQSITQAVSSIATLVGVVIMMLSISPIMTLIIIATLPLYGIVTKNIVKRSQKYFAANQKNLGDLNGHVEEMYTGHDIIKVYGREEQSLESFKEINEKLYQSAHKSFFVSGIIMPLMRLIGDISYVLVCVVGGILVTNQYITLGNIQAFIQYARQFTQPISQVADISNIIQSTVASAERVFEVLDEEEEISDSKDAKEIQFPKGEVQFKNVSFGYKKDLPVIKNFNLKVRQGQRIAIVGPTGAGKTTLVNLLMRFYEIDEGEIIIDGINIQDMRREDLRSMFGMVLQDTWLFQGSIRDNIAYGCEEVTDEKVVEAAKAAHANHFIMTLPQGYDTIINEEASNISQGQKQLLTIARAILANPFILILDEATSSVDTRTEHYIQKAMDNLMEDRTSFVIAHRLSTIKNADLILVMKEGNVIEKGSHKDLLDQKGFYYDLYFSQFSKDSNL